MRRLATFVTTVVLGAARHGTRSYELGRRPSSHASGRTACGRIGPPDLAKPETRAWRWRRGQSYRRQRCYANCILSPRVGTPHSILGNRSRAGLLGPNETGGGGAVRLDDRTETALASRRTRRPR